MSELDLAAASRALQDNDAVRAEAIVRAHLKNQPNDAKALRLLAHIVAGTGSAVEAELLLREAIRIAPTFIEAYVDLTSLLCKLERPNEAIALVEAVIGQQPGAIWPLSLKAGILDAERRTEDSVPLHRELVARAPHAAIPWLNYGNALGTVGRLDDAVAAYRRAVRIDPLNGYAWLGLANLRVIKFSIDDIAHLERAIARQADKLQLVQLHFTLARALGDHGRFAPSFDHYEEANRLRGELAPYDRQEMSGLVSKMEGIFSPVLFSRSAGVDQDDPVPIFILGMPRSGSTLVEQILASHPMVEGCGELFELRNLVSSLPNVWPDAVAEMGTDDLLALGQRYLASARRHRRTDRPFFTDKMPSNWQFIGLIRLMLPNAKIIDVRRHPLACCFSAFTTYFNLETRVPTNLADLGRYYADYVRAVGHFEAMSPGAIHYVQYERLIEDFEGETRQLFDYLSLPFDATCLDFHENRRSIYTPSAQQVRRPVNTDGLETWRGYEPNLRSLKEALGSEPSIQ